MTYFQFLLIFLVPVIIVLALLGNRRIDLFSQGEVWKWIGAVAVIAFVYTTPWDNYLVFRGVWYYGPDRVLATMGHVPIEEYLFFLLQPVLTGLFTVLVLDSFAKRQQKSLQSVAPSAWRSALVITWLAVSLCGALLLVLATSQLQFTYLGLILAWACPVLAGMSWISAGSFWTYRREMAISIWIPTLYLWAADRFAIGAGIWDISNTYSLDFDPLGLPIEEAVFFLVTNVLVVQGLVMFLPLKK